MNRNISSSENSYFWSPISLNHLLTRYSLTSWKCWGPILIWMLLIGASVALTVSILTGNRLFLTGNNFLFSSFFVFNPAFIIGVILLFWFGFDWGFIPIYLSAFLISIYSGVAVVWSLLIAIAFVLGLGLFALAYQSIRIPYTLRNFQSVAFFIVVSFIAALANSMGSFIWSLSNQLPAEQALLIWKSWWTGSFFQSVLIGGAVLFLLSPAVERAKRKFFEMPARPGVSPRWIYGAVASVTLTLALYIYSGHYLGKMYISEIASSQDVAALSHYMESIEAFEIITWTSIALIVIVGYAAVYLLDTWNKRLRKAVDMQTKELLESEENLKKLVREKEILIHEIQHRVKNNLSQVYSLLELQEMTTDNREAAELLKVGRSRIKTMVSAHEELYNHDDISNIGIRDYLGRIAKSTHDSYTVSTKKIVLKRSLEDASIDLSRAIPLGLMVSEIMINAHKHAFRNTDKGTIEVRSLVSDTDLRLIVRDNGAGIPQEPEKEKQGGKLKSLGMLLIRQFSDQLHAKMEINSSIGKGTEFRFTIPLKYLLPRRPKASGTGSA